MSEYPPGSFTTAQIAEWYIRRYEKRTGRPWHERDRRRIALPGDEDEDTVRARAEEERKGNDDREWAQERDRRSGIDFE